MDLKTQPLQLMLNNLIAQHVKSWFFDNNRDELGEFSKTLILEIEKVFLGQRGQTKASSIGISYGGTIFSYDHQSILQKNGKNFWMQYRLVKKCTCTATYIRD